MYAWIYDYFINTVLFPLTCLIGLGGFLILYGYKSIKKENSNS